MATDTTLRPWDIMRLAFVVVGHVLFLPHLRHIWTSRDRKQISLCHVVFNMMTATVKFTIGLFSLLVNIEFLRIFAWRPVLSVNMYSLVQLVASIQLFMGLFFVYFCHAPKGILGTGLLCIGFLLLFLVPAVINSTTASLKEENRRFVFSILLAVQIGQIYPLAAVAGARSFKIRSRRVGTRSVMVLYVQAIVFSILALSWITVFYYQLGYITQEDRNYFWGWVALNIVVFAIAQFFLLRVVNHLWKWKGVFHG